MTTRKLNDTFVPEKMYLDVAAIKRGGGKVFLVLGDDRAQRPEHCPNCVGTGAVGYQFFTGGPYEVPPNIQNLLPNANRPNDVPARATYHNGKWYKQKSKTFDCPSCEGTGLRGGKRISPKELAL